ncbi:MAG: glycosyltransferase family 2 protein [Shimia sp.]
MRTPRLSVVIVSRERPEALRRCLAGLQQQVHPRFEVVVVACPAGIAVLDPSMGVKAVPFDVPNISVARNLGIAQAAGEVVAFIDDDAVPEPGWLHEIDAAMTKGVDAVGGTVLGRNGISVQWPPRIFDAELRFTTLADGRPPIDLPRGHAVKTEGTNMAVRRSVLVALGGFDPAYAFYLDETDLNLRLARAGYRTTLAPRAVVHHGFAPSARRREDRVPTTLAVNGSSLAAFTAKHCPDARASVLARHRRAEEARLMRHMVNGALMPGDVPRLLATFDEGVAGGTAPMEAPALDAAPPFHPFGNTPPSDFIFFAVRWHRRRAARAEAAQLRREGHVVHLLIASPTARPHWVRFDAFSGVWEQSGGIFGRSLRVGPRWVKGGFRARAMGEYARVNFLKCPLSGRIETLSRA